MEPIEATAIGNQLGPLLLEDFPHGLLGALGMGMSLGVGDAPGPSARRSTRRKC